MFIYILVYDVTKITKYNVRGNCCFKSIVSELCAKFTTYCFYPLITFL